MDLSLQMNEAKKDIAKTIDDVAIKYKFPIYFMEAILKDILCDVSEMANNYRLQAMAEEVEKNEPRKTKEKN